MLRINKVKLTADKLEKDIKNIAETIEKVDYCKSQRASKIRKFFLFSMLSLYLVD